MLKSLRPGRDFGSAKAYSKAIGSRNPTLTALLLAERSLATADMLAKLESNARVDGRIRRKVLKAERLLADLDVSGLSDAIQREIHAYSALVIARSFFIRKQYSEALAHMDVFNQRMYLLTNHLDATAEQKETYIHLVARFQELSSVCRNFLGKGTSI